MYSRMPDDAAPNFVLLKKALLKRYNLTMDGYRNTFRWFRPKLYENKEQFITRLNTYLDKWILLSHTADTSNGIRDLFIREQFINACPKDLAAQLRERERERERQRKIPNLIELAQVAERFLTAHNRKFYSVPTTHKSNPLWLQGKPTVLNLRRHYWTTQTFSATFARHSATKRRNASLHLEQCVTYQNTGAGGKRLLV